MKDKQKIYIRGNKGRGDEVKDILTGLGAHVVTDISCNDDRFIYFINHDSEISVALVGSEVARIIMDNYKEIKLPLLPWNDRDVLVNNNCPDCYAAFKKYNDDGTFEAYFALYNKTAYFDATASVDSFHPASREELEDIPRLFFFLMCNLNEVSLCLPKKVVKYSTTDDDITSKSIKL